MNFENYLVKKIGNTPVKESESDCEMIRLAMKEELQAVNDYMKRAKMAQNEATRKLFLDIAKEERVHFEEFEELLEVLDSEYEDAEEEAEDEIEDLFGEDEDEDEDE